MSKCGNGVIAVNGGVVDVHPVRGEDGPDNHIQLGKHLSMPALQLLDSAAIPFIKCLIGYSCFVYESDYFVPGHLGSLNKFLNLALSKFEIFLKVRVILETKLEEIFTVVQ